MKKVLAIALSLFLVLCAGCGLDSVQQTNSNANGNQESTNQTVGKVIIDNDDMKVTYQGISEMASLSVFYVNLKVENKLTQEVTVNLESADVDGETIPLITTGVPLTIRPGNSGATNFIFSMVNLSIDTVNSAKLATFKVVMRSSADYSVLSESDLVTVNLHG